MNTRQTAIVTGGRRGIGRVIAARLSKDGFNVVINAVNPPQKDDSFDDMSGEFLFVEGDISLASCRENLIAQTIKRFGSIHVLVNNAGVAPKERADLLDMSEESYDYVMNINAKANMFLTQAAAKIMMNQPLAGKKRGTIINISSCSAAVSSINRGEYCVSKAAISMLNTLYADRLAGEGIFVHEIRPGVIQTDMTEKVKGKYDALIENGTFPIARWGSAEDVANAVSVFAGENFLYTTGNVVDVDGGFHIRRL